MGRLRKWQFWLCLLLSVPALMVAQSEYRSEPPDPAAEYASAVAMAVPAAMYFLAAIWILRPRGVWTAFAASSLSCGLIFLGMQYEVGLEAGLVIYALAATGFGANLAYERRKARC